MYLRFLCKGGLELNKWAKIVMGVSLAVIITGVWGYWRINPGNHFKQMDHPVLAQPMSSTNAEVPRTISELPNRSPSPSPLAVQLDPSTFNVLILGIDARAEESSRTDFIMVAHVDPMAKTVNVVSIPRDTRVNLPGIGNTKINHAHFIGNEKGGNNAGTEASIQAVSDLLDIPINYYFKTNFEGFVHFVDSIDGIGVDLPQEVKLDQRLKGKGITILPAGKQKLDGALTLDFVRERFSLPNGDFDRQSDQLMVLKLIAEKMTRISFLPKLPSLLIQVKRDVIDTNFKESDLISLAWLFKDLKGDQVQYFQLPGHSDYAFDPLVKMKLYYWVPNAKDVQDISKKYLSNVAKS
jgi:polyisoprenyl-teichoic acid--peptidoglycan teichoic acid transferase